MTETPESSTPANRPTAAEKRAAAVAAQTANQAQATPQAQTPVEAQTPVAAPAAAQATPVETPAVAQAEPVAATAATSELPPTSAFAAPKPAKEKSPKRSVSLGVAAAIVAAALVGGVSGAGVSLWAVSLNQETPRETTSTPTTITVNDPNNASNTTAVALKASDSVVTISVASDNGGGTGSGVVLTKDGYVLTNTHVVTLEGATSAPNVTVTMNDGHIYEATLVGTDPIADLAVIKIKGADNLVPAEFADSDDLNVGDTAIAIGAPLGLSGTVTDGIVSSLNRSISIASSAAPDGSPEQDDESEENPFDFWQFDIPGQEQAPSSSSSTISLAVIQTDAAINPGNSGGALLDSEGRVIGINVAIASAGSADGQSGSIGVGFAIPSNLAQRVANEIIENGFATHGLLGAAVLDVAEDQEVTANSTVGAVIKEATPGGAADKAGLKAGDVITKLDGVRITGKTDLTAQVRAHAAGADAVVTYVRDGKAFETTVTLGTLEI